MSQYTDQLFGINTGQQDPTSYTMPATIQFPYEGQMYDIPTAGFNSEEEAIDAFLAEQNPPTDIRLAEEGDTDQQKTGENDVE